MTQRRLLMTNRAFHGMVVAVMVVTLVYPSLSSGENVSPGSDAHSMTDSNKDPQGLLAQITDLQAEVAKLRAAVQQTDPMKRSRAGSRMKMGGGKAMVVMDDMGERGIKAKTQTLNSELDVMPITGHRVNIASTIAPHSNDKAWHGFISTGTVFSAAEAQVLIDFSSCC